ncbi:MAG: co-chaperone DjlA [gamma proteobacterium symbiont of Bathyaustriella thionipta]|nr:co-chaperone DjlA [gamma proteobacterium symbiont of Bathyaustriella thionipta]MCU7948924.1 co-chaperone DjlA [gamma proteobacterium symbiont of Bathyaustriella thionipta]MCU7954313.1 co-chaperone DjlA [gamma proteobacterium symbiont of Bathyaustriella thionipta]MCU7955631.1 co-chaperone DjlA [gamma proteobacterium symbiont of Bathyaustriella thionipta]MCU7966635.1 co-chaperone DjlA [gamma proteobacterium symbiont of Bathyaustriella thionipta]
MSWWGKFLGGAVGFTMGGPLGLLIGGVIGHKLVDKPLQGSDNELTQAAFFSATFSIMGHIAKADGHVSKDEIAMAQQIMDHMKLDAQQKRAAIELFNKGKQSNFDLDGVLAQFKQVAHRRTTLLQMFLEIQLHAALADGQIDAAEQLIINKIAQQLGFSARHIEQLTALVRSNLGLGGNRYHYGTTDSHKSHSELLKEAYEMLGMTRSASDAEVKKSYRRLMNQHHPDKLVSKGLPEEMIQMATEKTQQIKAAYEMIKETRKR